MGFWKKHWGWFIDISSLGVVRRNFPRFEFLKWRLQKTYQPPFLHPLPAKVQTENRHRFSHLGHMLCGQERASCATVWVTITKPLLLWESWVPSLGWEDPLEKGKATLPTPVFWPGEFNRLYSPWDCKESDTTEWLSLAHSTVYLRFHIHGFNQSQLFSTLVHVY